MDLFVNIIEVVQLLLLIYLGFAAIYIFIYAVAGLFRRNLKLNLNTDKRKIAVLIPAYKEDQVILEVAEDALKQDYPQDHYDVVIIADSFKPETIKELNKLPIVVIQVDFEVSTKSKALNKAMAMLPDDYYDIAVILDADNLMEKNFLTRINACFSNNFNVVQGHRMAKNLNTPFAILDAISEEINNHIFRLGHRALGLNSALIGSGMGFNYDFFKNIMSKVKAVGGFDKELEVLMAEDRIKVEYDQQAYVLDEKVQKSEVFYKQRKRWISAQLVYFRKFFFRSFLHFIRKGNIDYFNKALQFILPPRILLIGFSAMLTILSVIFQEIFYSSSWIALMSMIILSLLLSVPVKYYNKQTLSAVMLLPKGFMLMFLSLITSKGANKRFIHTEHTSSGRQ